MSDEQQPSEEKAEQAPEAPSLVARFSPSRWPGLIWAVPIAALAIVGTLAIRSFMAQGPHVTVSFHTTGGISAGHTDVEYRGVTVGHVTAVQLSHSLQEMTVTLSFDHAMTGHLGRGTRFWIGGGTPSLTDLSSLKTLISGPYIAVAPVAGAAVGHFTGLAEPPVLKWETNGGTFSLTTDNPGNVSRGAPVYFHHYKVGEVRGLRFDPGTRHFKVLVFIEQQYEQLVNARSRFWNAGAVHFTVGGKGPGIMLESVPALLVGAIAFETPGKAPAAKGGETFRLYPSKAAAESAPGPHAVAFRIVFPGGPHGLASGAGVTLEGAPAGVVTAVHALYDPAAGAMRTHVRIALDPERIGRPAGKSWNLHDPAPEMKAMLATLIGHGLRARLTAATPVIGGEEIALDLVPNAAPATLEASSPPTIPATGAAGAGAIMTQLANILAKLDALPLPAIADNIHAATQKLAALSGSPAARDTLSRLNSTIKHLDAITSATDAHWPAVMANIQASAFQADKALAAARALLSRESTTASAPESTTLPRALYELSRAARSLRELSDYLANHPNSVIFGRSR